MTNLDVRWLIIITLVVSVMVVVISCVLWVERKILKDRTNTNHHRHPTDEDYAALGIEKDK